MRIIAFVSFSVLASTSIVTPAGAQEWYTGAREKGPEPSFGAAVDASLSATTKGSLHAGLIGTIAPFGPSNESGMRLRIGGIVGNYAYMSTTPGVGKVTGHETNGSVMVGYEWVMRNATLAVYVGGEVQNRTLNKVDPSNSVTGVAGGFKTSVDFYANPTTYSMVSATATFSTANNAYYTRLKAGIGVTERIFVGPEALFLGDNFYSQYRLGVHLTGAQLGPMQFGVSGGYMHDRRAGAGGYGILDARVGF